MKNVVPVTGHDFQSVTTMEGIKKGIEIEIEGKYQGWKKAGFFFKKKPDHRLFLGFFWVFF